MRVSYTRLLACAVLVISISFAQAAFGADILIADAKSQPESLTMAPGGVLMWDPLESTCRHASLSIL